MCIHTLRKGAFLHILRERLPLRLLLRRFADMYSTDSEINRWKCQDVSVRCAQLTEFQSVLVCDFRSSFFEKSNTDQTSHVAKLGRFSPSSSSILFLRSDRFASSPDAGGYVCTRARTATLFSFLGFLPCGFPLLLLAYCALSLRSHTRKRRRDVRSCNVLAVLMCAVCSRLLGGRRREYVAGVRLCSSISFRTSLRLVQLCGVAGTHARAETLLCAQPRNVRTTTDLPAHEFALSRSKTDTLRSLSSAFSYNYFYFLFSLK